jgi:hypothetical protein
MRTTVTLDPDVVAKLRQVARERGESFKAVLNDAVRAGLAPGSRRGRSYRMPSRRMGVRPGIDLDRALRLAADSEDAEIVRRLALRK